LERGAGAIHVDSTRIDIGISRGCGAVTGFAIVWGTRFRGERRSFRLDSD
jgi:hypothetical protein